MKAMTAKQATCPNCGCPLNTPPPSRLNRILSMTGAWLLILLIPGLITMAVLYGAQAAWLTFAGWFIVVVLTALAAKATQPKAGAT